MQKPLASSQHMSKITELFHELAEIRTSPQYTTSLASAGKAISLRPTPSDRATSLASARETKSLRPTNSLKKATSLASAGTRDNLDRPLLRKKPHAWPQQEGEHGLSSYADFGSWEASPGGARKPQEAKRSPKGIPGAELVGARGIPGASRSFLWRPEPS